MKKFTSLLFAVVGALSAHAASTTVDFTYNPDGGQVYAFGYDKIETINVAIRINEPSLVGAQVVSMSVPITTDMNVNKLGECSAFLTTKLDKSGKENLANICTETATIDENNMLTCTFSEPYTITDEGVYVGYTMPITSVSASDHCYPIAISEGENPNGLYIFSSRSVISWTSKSVALGGVSPMVVKIAGDFAENAAGVALESTYPLICNQKNDVSVKLINYGSKPLTSVDYSYTIGSVSGSETKELTKPINGIGSFAWCPLSVSTPSEIGPTDFELTLTKVNGVEINPVKASTTVNITPFKIVNRPVAEEFTGLWCGWCPRGYAAMETLKEEYGEDFIGLAYHNDDPMATMSKYPVNVTGFPEATVNRGKIDDAGAILNSWPAAAAKSVDSNVEVELGWANEEKTIIRATVKVRFLEDKNGADYRIGACLVADGMTNPTWGQSNYYYNQSQQGLPLLDELFVGKDQKIYGLEFNDVVISFPNMFGKTTGIPAQIKQYEPVTYTEDFDLNSVRNLDKFYTNPIQDIEKLRVVGILFDQNGMPLNAASSGYSTAGGELDYPGVAAPVITGVVPAKDGNPAEITFNCPSTYGGESDVLTPNDTPVGSNGAVTSYFRVGLYVDDKPYTFKKDDYPGLNKNETTLVYGNRGVGNTSFANQQMTIKVFVDEASTFGVQTNYIYGTTKLQSPIITVDANEEFSSIVSVNAPADMAPVYYDLQGRQVASPRAGQLLIMKSAEGTKKIRY